MTKTTPTMEDYIEVIYSLVKNKGYARSADIAEKLEALLLQKTEEKWENTLLLDMNY